MRLRFTLDQHNDGIRSTLTSLFVYLGKVMIGRVYGQGLFPKCWMYHFTTTESFGGFTPAGAFMMTMALA
jgi:hypothetical protein